MKPFKTALSVEGRWWGQPSECTMEAYLELSQWIPPCIMNIC
jgi:hypothetical protein